MRILRWACIALALGAALGSGARESSAHPDGEKILAVAKSTFRDVQRPPYVVYTVARVERQYGTIDFDDTYTDRVWYRASDHAALTRRVEGGRATGALVFERPRFNAPLDPGPPTADIFERSPEQHAAGETPEPEATEKTIATVVAGVESDYKVRLGKDDKRAYHLYLTPRRDPERNRLRELWVNRDDYAVARMIATDRLYERDSPASYPQLIDVTLTVRDGLPLITHVLMTTDFSTGEAAGAPDESGDFTFSDIELPASLPGWYFAPETYGRHADEAPTW